MILLRTGMLDSKTIRQALVAFTLMERYLIHFEDNYRQMFSQAQRQMAREIGNEYSSQGAHASSASMSQKLAQTSLKIGSQSFSGTGDG